MFPHTYHVITCVFQVHHGIKGMVYDENNNPIGKAEVSVAGVNHDVTTGEKGAAGVSVKQMWMCHCVVGLKKCASVCVCVW